VKQAVVVGQLTVVNPSWVTVVAADHVPLLKVNASPMRSTAIQKLLDGQEMAVSEYGLTAAVTVHVVPFHDSTLPLLLTARHDEFDAHDTADRLDAPVGFV